jgi:hypothetical protein
MDPAGPNLGMTGYGQEHAVQRYYKAFISSTFRDLAPHRQQAMQAILRAGHMPVALENFTPETESKRKVITEALKKCQFYVIVLGYRYGSIPEDQDLLPEELRGKSYTEIELDMAVDAKLPVLAFIMDSDEVTKGRATKDWVDSDEPLYKEKYQALRCRLTEGIEKPLARPFSKPEDVFNELYAYFQREHRGIRGYILEPESSSDVDIILRFSSGNQVARDVVEALAKFSDVRPAASDCPAKKGSTCPGIS